MSEDRSYSTDDYFRILREFIISGSEAALYEASQLSRAFVEQGVGPEDIVALHVEALQRATVDLSYRDQARAATDGLQFLLEVMITYGVQYKAYLDLRIQQLSKAEIDKGELLRTIAHELRTPLTAAAGSIDMARRSITAGRLERIPDLLDRSREAMERMSRLTSDLYDASRGEMPQIEHDAQRLDAILAQACGWISHSAADKEMRVVFETALVPAQVWGDEDALITVFANLLTNAVRYTPNGGQITVRHGGDVDWAWAEVEDTGIGMSPEVSARIFEKFYRGPEARASDARGLGLGLALVKQIVESHGGTIRVTTAPGEGSRFRVVLPARELGTSHGFIREEQRERSA